MNEGAARRPLKKLPFGLRQIEFSCQIPENGCGAGVARCGAEAESDLHSAREPRREVRPFGAGKDGGREGGKWGATPQVTEHRRLNITCIRHVTTGSGGTTTRTTACLLQRRHGLPGKSLPTRGYLCWLWLSVEFVVGQHIPLSSQLRA